MFDVILGYSVLFAGYLLLKHKLHISINRIYLLLCIFIPLILPVVQVETDQQHFAYLPEVSEMFRPRSNQIDPPDEAKSAGKNSVDRAGQKLASGNKSSASDRTKILFIAYGGISVLLLIKLLVSLISLFLLKRGAALAEEGSKYRIVEKDGFTAASFFGLIFIHKRFLNFPALKYILAHEQAHKRRLHSLDILISEFYCILFWVNPFAWLLRKEIRLNTELEADHVISGDLDTVQYAKVLVALSSKGSIISTLNLFSAMDTKRRVQKILHQKQHNWATSLLTLPFGILAIWLISCEPELSGYNQDPAEAFKHIKTITTKYISHQEDTQNKDEKVVAIATFLPDGSVDNVTQYMSYPYNFEDPVEINFWSHPEPTNIPLILDGLRLGTAEYNFLYGNSWPKKYAAISQKGHPVYRGSELMAFKTNVDLDEAGFPLKIATHLNREEINDHSYIEEFKQDQQNYVSHYTSYVRYNPNNFPEEVRKTFPSKVNFTEMQFGYADDQLAHVTEDKSGDSPKSYHFEYESGKLARSTYYLNGKLYVTRNYYYSKSGLKTKAEILNVNGEPEYTILYDYAFYE